MWARLREFLAFEFLAFEFLFLAIAACAAVVLGWLTDEVLEGETRQFDLLVHTTVHQWTPPWFTGAMRFFTDLGSPITVLLLTTGVVLLFYRAGWTRAVIVFLVAMAGAVVLTEALKLAFHRPRPAPYFDILAPHSFSYPSGHALAAFTLYGTLAAILSARLQRKRAVTALWTAAALIIACIGFSRVYLGVHYATDVVAGYLVAFVWVAALGAGDRRYIRWRARNESA